MESNFATGIIIGIIIGIVGVKIFAPTEISANVSKPQVQTKTVVIPRYVNTYYDDYDREEEPIDYSTYGLHERGF